MRRRDPDRLAKRLLRSPLLVLVVLVFLLCAVAGFVAGWVCKLAGWLDNDKERTS